MNQEIKESVLLVYEMMPERVEFYLIQKEDNGEVIEILKKANGIIINCDYDNKEAYEAALGLNALLNPEDENSIHKYHIEDVCALASDVNITSVFRGGFWL